MAERLGATAAVMTVAANTTLNDDLREIVLAHPDAIALAGLAGQDVMIRLEGERGPLRRRYSVRRVDAELATLTIWAETAHDGVGATWARSTTVGDEVDVIGPRGKILLDEMADWHLFVGDLSAVGAFYRLAESVDPPGQVLFVIEVDRASSIVTPELPELVTPTGVFVERQQRSHGDPTGLLNALASLDLPIGEGHAYLFGEHQCVKVVASALVDRGLGTEAISSKAFWRVGLNNQDHGEPDKAD